MINDFKEILTDTVILIKANGSQVNDITANVQSRKILIPDSSLLIEEGDKIVRKLPNGLEEVYIVDDRGYRAGMPGMIDAHYQLQVHKETKIQQNQNINQTIINQHYGNGDIVGNDKVGNDKVGNDKVGNDKFL